MIVSNEDGRETMCFELIMLFGFFGIALASLLPAAPAQESDAGLHGVLRVLRRTGKRHATARGRWMTTRGVAASRRRNAGHAAA
jgi:hypothetical protein